jgi:hypothetical protein
LTEKWLSRRKEKDRPRMSRWGFAAALITACFAGCADYRSVGYTQEQRVCFLRVSGPPSLCEGRHPLGWHHDSTWDNPDVFSGPIEP